MSFTDADSKGIRSKALATIDHGVPRREVQDLFGLSRSTIKLWLKRRRLTGDVAIHKIPGKPSVKDEALRGWLPAHLKGNPDLSHRASQTSGRGFLPRGQPTNLTIPRPTRKSPAAPSSTTEAARP
jgi:hypothetical protein